VPRVFLVLALIALIILLLCWVLWKRHDSGAPPAQPAPSSTPQPVPHAAVSVAAAAPLPVIAPTTQALAVSPSTAPLGATAVPAAVADAAAVAAVAFAQVGQPFTPSPTHSPLVPWPDAVDGYRIHAVASRDPQAAAILVVGDDRRDAAPLAVVEDALTVAVDPGATVVFYAAQLGSFALGGNRPWIAVQADPAGHARAQFRAGLDTGLYRVHAASPTRAGLATFTIDVTPATTTP
jgi:hypothetical protein